MKLINRFNDYLSDREYKIIIKENYFDIVNYDEIIEFTLNKVSIKYQNKVIIIEGKNLVITKMFECEVLITGNITNVSIN